MPLVEPIQSLAVTSCFSLVYAVGEDAYRFKAGDRVSIMPSFDITKYGVLGDYTLIPEGSLIELPDNSSMIGGASVWMSYFTAWLALTVWVRLPPEASIVVYRGLSIEKTPYPLYPAIAKGLDFSSLVNLLQLEIAKEEIISVFNEGVYKPVIDRILPIQDLKEAYEYLGNGSLMGKVAVQNDL